VRRGRWASRSERSGQTMWVRLSEIRLLDKSDRHEGRHAGVTLMHDEVDVPWRDRRRRVRGWTST